jgi:uncharacterized coiled-coil protein SlyX
MTTRAEIQAAMEQKLAEGEAAVARLKTKLGEAGDDASAELSDTVNEAEHLMKRGRAKLDELAEATDDQFDEWWADAKSSWHEVSHDIEHHWDHLSAKVKRYFS